MTTDELNKLKAFIEECEKIEKDISNLDWLLTSLGSTEMEARWKRQFNLTCVPGEDSESTIFLRSEVGSEIGDKIRRAIYATALEGRYILIDHLREIPKP